MERTPMNAHIRATMPRRKTMAAIVGLLIAAASAHANHGALPDGVTPIEATWLWGHYIVPDTITKDGAPYVFAYPHKDSARIIDPPWTEVASEHIKSGAKAPAALFLHGCSGMIRGGIGYRILLMTKGYAVFEPDAFARPGYTCDGSSLSMRREEIAHALAQIRKLSWVDQDRIVLMGNSQGGTAVARWDEPGFAAHVILAASCTTRSDTGQRSPLAPEGVPVLSVIGSKDDYFAGKECAITRTIGGSKAVVILDAGHDIQGRPELKQAVGTFLDTCCR
jgi:dienelactone hydrolase